MGMELKSRGEFTVNGARAFLFKVLHPNGDTNWGKWVMLAENGENTLEVNAAFISGDAAAASDLEVMLKGVYMEPPRPVSTGPDVMPPVETSERPVSVTPISEDARAGKAPFQTTAKNTDVLAPKGAISQDVRSESEREPASSEKDSIKPDAPVSADLAKPAGSDGDVRRNGAASNDVPVSPDTGGDVSSDQSVRKTEVRIITENGIVSVDDAPTGMPGGENGSGE